MKDIDNKNTKGEWHGYNQWIDKSGKLWVRGVFKHGELVGYHEVNHDIGGIGYEGTEVQFYIK